MARWGDEWAAGRGGGSIWPRVVAGFSFDAVRVSFAVVLRFACSIMPCIEAEMAEVAAVAAVLNGDAGLRGDVGRAIMLFVGEEGAIAYSLIGERGSVLEL